MPALFVRRRAMKKSLNYKTSRKLWGYVLLIPGFFFLGCFTLFPFAKSIVMSFTDWNAINPDFSFVGLKNYSDVFHNQDYWNAIKVNLIFAVISTAIQTILGFLLAFMVYYLKSGWQKFYKVALYLPVILPASVIAVMWRFLLNYDSGLINSILRGVGLDFLTHAWIGEKSTALGTIIAVNTWQYIGFTMVLFYIAMVNIPKDVLESAAVDGATKKDLFFYFFLPLTAGTTETNVVLSISGGMKSFALFYMLTGGGPGTTTQVVAMLIYNAAFVNFKFSRALAMSSILFVIILALVVLSRKIGRKYNYEYQ